MQLSARILTALAVLAFTVAIVADRSASDEVSAATGTIDALNVGACTTNNADAFSKNNCTQTTAFFQQGELDSLIEVDTVYATYAHDPKTAAENPRAIIEDGDLIRVSITDKGRDRRDPVLITSSNAAFDNPTAGTDDGDPFGPTAAPTADPVVVNTLLTSTGDDTTTTEEDESVNPQAIVAESALGDDEKTADLPGLEQIVEFGADDAGTDTIFESSGSYQVLFQGGTATAPYKPIAPDGDVKFFGRVSADGDTTFDIDEKFQDIGKWVKRDEDVISGDTNIAPAIKLNVSVPNDGAVALQLIFYQTSGVEYIEGGIQCVDDPEVDPADLLSFAQAECTADERKPGTEDDPNAGNASFQLYAVSDVDAGGNGITDSDETNHASEQKNLALIETGRFTGVFQGYLRLTDADGIGGNERANWGLMRESGSLVADLEGGIDAEELSNAKAVLGVGNGPVTIMYKDSDGNNQSFNVELDIEPPTIQIDSPGHDERSDDEKPSFIGTFNDADSGLAADTFQLNVDNRDEEAAMPIMSISSGVDGTGDDGTGQVLRRLDYTGWSDANDLFGVIGDTDLEGQLYRPVHPEVAKGEEVYKSVEADDFADGDPDGEFNEEVEIDFDESESVVPNEPDGTFVFNHAIDFQAAVRDLAGNIGFSDSDAANPRFIDALGEEKLVDRNKGPRTHNVLGYFSAHIVHIDDKDPEIMMDQSVTGFYSLDGDGNPVRDRSAVMVAFDGGVNGDLIDTGTFTLEYDDESAIAITDVNVDGKLVFLKLGEELASDARPTLSITEGREVEDMAGNILSWQEKKAEAFKVHDGILPVFTLILSGGSGTGVGGESPSKLTSAAIDIAIASDEDINGAPRVAVVCSNVKFNEETSSTNSALKQADGAAVAYDLGRYESNRNGYADDSGLETGLKCGDVTKDLRGASSLSRPGNNWIYAWRNSSDANAAAHLADGELVVVVWGRDRSEYDGHNDDICAGDCENWGSETTRFVLDNTLNSPLKADDSGGSVQPEADSEVKEPRPFILLDFAGEATSVKVTEFSVDGNDALSGLSSIGDNRFLYWPEALEFGTHKVAFDARDAADNKPDGKTSFEFEVTARAPFVLDLSAGWNAISFPADPVDTALDAVFTEEAVDRVIGWNPMSSNGAWSIATRVDGVWTTSMDFAPLTDVVVRYGYWVHSSAFVKQSVDLKGPVNRETGGKPHPIGIPTVPGWNFIGVVDQDGDQTENHFGKELRDSDKTPANPNGVIVRAKDYLPGFVQAYTWDGIANGYRVLGGDAPMVIGKGVWVFFPDGTAVAP